MHTSELTLTARKGIALGLAVSTLLWAATLWALPAFVSAAPHSDGCLINSSGTIYLVTGGQKRGFPTAEVFASHGYSFSQVVAASSEDTQAMGPVMVYADGTLVKGPSDPLVYLVANGQKRGFVSGSVFTGLGFSFASIVTAATNTFADLPMGANLESATERHTAGVLAKDSTGTVWQMTATGRKGVPSMEVFNSYGWSWSNVVAANAADTAAANEGVVAARASCSTGATPPPPPAGTMSVSLASNNPVAGTVIAGQGVADLAHFSFSGSGKVTSVVLKRLGVSSDTTLSAVYLYDGYVRLTDSATVSSGTITFNNTAGLFTVAGSRTVTVRSNIAASTSGQTVGVQLFSAAADVGTVSGSPLSGNMHTVAAAPSNFATVDFNATTTPSNATISPQDDYTMWQNVVTVGNTKVRLYAFKLRQVGSVVASDLQNFDLFVDGTKVASVAALDSEGYANFDLSAAPVTLETGSRTIKMLGDIIGGSNRNFAFSLRQAVDGFFVDNDFNQGVLPTAASATFSARGNTDDNLQTISTGTITFTKRADSPSGNVVNAASNVLLAKFDVKAAGESMKVETLRVRIDDDDGDEMTLRNGALYLDGAQIGSTAAISGDTGTDPDYTEYTFGSSFIVVPGTPRVLEVKADIFDNDGTNSVAASDTYQVEIIGSANVQRLTSLGYVSAPSTAAEANTLTVATGSLTAALDTSLANHTIVAPKYGYMIGKYTIQQTTTEGANITSVVVDFDEKADAFDGSDDLTNLYIKMGSYTSPIKATVTDTGNTFSTNVAIAAGQVMALEVYADVAASATNGDGTADTIESSVTVASTTTQSSTSATADEVDGQTITAGAGTFATAVAPDTPVNRITYGNQEVEAARFKITATNETYTLRQWNMKVGASPISSAIVEARLYYGSTLLGSAPFSVTSNTIAQITGLESKAEAVVAANTSRTFSVKLLLNQIGGNYGTSQQNVAVTSDALIIQDSQGVQDSTSSAVTTDRVGNELYVYKGTPKVEVVDLTNSTLVNGSAQDVYKFKVTGQGGTVAVKQVKLSVAWSDGGTADTLEVESLKFYKNDVDITASVTMVDEDGNDVETTSGLTEDDDTLVVTFTTEDAVAAGESVTYRVRGTPQAFRATGTDTVGDSVSFNVPSDASHNGTSVFLNDQTDINAGQSEIMELFTSAAASSSDGTAANFIWSDNSATAHVSTANATSTGDWANGYNVLNLPLDGETWTK
ncbi:MAG: hypothetical protein HYV13_03210 [Candidatus Doudnabacteria bacterium]|nr:hypothetical protein [Candidatus Doudnabacteria bacterium]